MAPKEIPPAQDPALAPRELANMVDPLHALVILAGKMNWQAASAQFGPLYVPSRGRPAISIRLMVGLHYLKHAFNLSGCEFLLKLTIDAGVITKTIVPASLEAAHVDTTVHEKAIAFPTDGRLYHKARVTLVREAKKPGLRLRQSYERLGKQALVMNARYAHARQMKRARREQKRLRTYLGRVMRDIERKIQAAPALEDRFRNWLNIGHRIHAQQRHDKKKIYSVHAPEVECIAKGKAHKHYEFGVKVSVVTTSRDNFVVGMQSLPSNPYDGHTLEAAIEQTVNLTGMTPKQAFADRGYKGHRPQHLAVWIAGAKRGVTNLIKKRLKRRNAVEPVIGHTKADGRLGRNFLKGTLGDAMNTVLCAAGCQRQSKTDTALFGIGN